MTVEVPRVTVDWLALREPADAAARSTDLVARLATRPGMVIHDLGSGTGSMRRWLAPQLRDPQHWVLYDRDAELLEHAKLMDGSVETRITDITRLTAADLRGADLVTASALLDMLTAEEIERIVAACAGAGCPALFTLSVTGEVQLTPADPLDAEIAEAFNAHQRRRLGDRDLLGPDAVDATAEAFRRSGVSVLTRPSPWRLGPDQADLIAVWLDGWLGAACEQRPDLAGPAEEYRHRRLTEPINVVVHHTDLLAGSE